ncbi:GNAT family N-acetyltransferase [Solitalea canadensis]|uniref:Acetyltransferase, N-acetylglutamate synthase n=1 Tax=Solitalea canadensis (strain ATCC 29591 / DSM 3403 / JCM 21819 / LMG 8368 / NBRC 15130 / NCIMB 12057 / USAM 9D) TaxID=929556 RepID=H8KP95_SOLCM|nr:GNAT family N-acetyltransferase [Solitalea canadensis]AFD05732.1 acetyltransferase, N-acetylglutamate synthase [Solitalea canadensis DSM 3403]
MQIRKADLNDISQLKELYYNTITTINVFDYNAEQIAAWASTADRTDSLANRIESQYFYICETTEGIITGFSSLEEDGYLDLMYVHKDYQRQGIATLLLNAIISKATELNLTGLTTEASITAKSFFIKNGFEVTEEQKVFINYIGLTNYKMRFNFKS